ncbi:hypothetical protein D3C79_936040 [compost metagenome]
MAYFRQAVRLCFIKRGESLRNRSTLGFISPDIPFIRSDAGNGNIVRADQTADLCRDFCAQRFFGQGQFCRGNAQDETGGIIGCMDFQTTGNDDLAVRIRFCLNKHGSILITTVANSSGRGEKSDFRVPERSVLKGT